MMSAKENWVFRTKHDPDTTIGYQCADSRHGAYFYPRTWKPGIVEVAFWGGSWMGMLNLYKQVLIMIVFVSETHVRNVRRTWNPLLHISIPFILGHMDFFGDSLAGAVRAYLLENGS
jgi:hypothetical protein